MKFPLRTTIWVAIFAAAFGLVEAVVVVYLRGLYYPEGFVFPLKLIQQHHLTAELVREFCTLVMLAAVGAIAGTSRWQKFSWFMLAFAVWDIFYYIWLKVFLNWPASVFDWDILFLIPVPWIAPVIAPVLVSMIMVVAAVLIVRHEASGRVFSPPVQTWILGIAGTAFVLFTFMRDTGATLQGGMPEPFSYGLFTAGILLYVGAIYFSLRVPSGDKG